MNHHLDGARFRLVPCGPAGLPADDALTLSDELRANCAATAELYRSVGYAPPWIGYLAAFGRRAVGGGAFVGAPRGGRVEIAYFTLPDSQGQGVASRTAAALIATARAAAPDVTIFAETLPEPGPSPTILSSLGFVRAGVVEDHEIGRAWAWELFPGSIGEGSAR